MPAALCWWLIVASLLVARVGAQPQATSAEALMGAAQVLQDVEGRYAEAIAAYRKVLAAPGVSRATAARAQLMIGVCHERLGQNEARAAYQVVVSKYADQKDSFAEAQKRLAALDGPPRSSGVTLKQVPLTVKADMIGPPSPDGQFILARTARGDDVVIQNLRTGQLRQITRADPTTHELNASGLLFAPDGNRVAYDWMNKDGSSIELHVYDLKSSSDKVVHAYARLDVICWSPDGESIVFIDYKNGSISSLSLKDGSLKVIIGSERKETVGRGAISPSGSYFAYDFKMGDAKGSDVVIVPLGGGLEASVASGEGTKSVVGWSPDGTTLFFTSDQSGTVDLFKVTVAKGQAVGGAAVVQRDLGPITPLGITRDGALFFSRERNLTDVLVADFDLGSGQVTSKPAYLDFGNLTRASHPTWSPDGAFLAYHCGMRPGADRPTFVDTLCIKSFTDKAITKLKLEASIYSAMPFSWCCEGSELRIRGLSVEKKPVYWRFDPETGRVLGQLPMGRNVIRFPFDTTTRTTRVSAVDPNGKETEIYRGQIDERARVLATSSDSKWVALVTFPAGGGNVGTWRLILAAKDGGGHKELLTLSAPEIVAQAAFVAGADYLLCVVSTDDPDVDQVWKVPFDGSPYRKLDFGQKRLRDIAVRPGGKTVAFVSYQTDRPEVWTLENIAAAAPAVQKNQSRREPE